jgi:hypothetical protein
VGGLLKELVALAINRLYDTRVENRAVASIRLIPYVCEVAESIVRAKQESEHTKDI